jgi:anti-sigma B factor antagonist
VLADSDGNVTLRISGKLDIYTAAQLRTRMDRHDPAVESISVDISEVWHIDSTGLGTLMSFANRARRSGRRLGLVCGPEFLELLEFTRMTDAFDLMPTDALA